MAKTMRRLPPPGVAAELLPLLSMSIKLKLGDFCCSPSSLLRVCMGGSSCKGRCNQPITKPQWRFGSFLSQGGPE